jgi:hypothetical protein
MGSKVYTSTEIQDLRQAAEGQVISGPQSQLALPGGISAGPGASISITGADTGKTFEQILDASQSSLGQVLGLTSQLASGIFGGGKTAAVSTYAAPQQAGILTKDSKLVLIGLGIVILFGLAGARR